MKLSSTLTSIIILSTFLTASVGIHLHENHERSNKTQTILHFQDSMEPEQLFINPTKNTKWEKTNYSESENTLYVGDISADDLPELLFESGQKSLENGLDHITINLNSFGGHVTEMEIFILAMNDLKNLGLKVNTIVQDGSNCMSACTLIFLSGDKRTIEDGSIWMFHSPYFGIPKKLLYSMIPARQKYIHIEESALREKFIQIYENSCPATDIREILEAKKDAFLSGKRLKKICKGYFVE